MNGQLHVAAVLLCLLTKAASLHVDAADGGYKDLLIVIHEDVPYNESIVENIKALLRSSSKFLHQATNGRVYFKHVTIAFPKTWPERGSARRVSRSLFEKSDVRVKLPGSVDEGRPFTKHVKPCGEPGDFIQIPPEFLAELNASTTAKYINPAYVFVHEWAHYRYGVFDEYGSPEDEDYPLWDCSGRMIKLNSCAKKIRFRLCLPNGKPCSRQGSECRFEKNCLVRIEAKETDAIESSIMFMPYQRNINYFCETSGRRQHNKDAKTKQNTLCSQRSTWEVISDNEDFKKATHSDTSKNIVVSFDEMQHIDLPQRVVMVLDVSSSMDDDRRLEFLQEAAQRYIAEIPDGSQRLAIVAFSAVAMVHHALMPVNATTRPLFQEAIENLYTETSTCIGCGLRTALEVLNTTDETPEGTVILLISDGEENESPYIANVTAEVLAAKVEVSIFLLGDEADKKLENLAIDTKGKAFSFQDLKGNTGLQLEAAFVEATTVQTDELPGRYTLIIDTPTSFTKEHKEEFILEDSLGNNTLVLIQRMEPDSPPITVWLVDPSGQKCQACREDDKDATKTIYIPSPAAAGTWAIHVESSSFEEMEVNIQVKSQAKDPDDVPIRTSCRMTSLQVANVNEAIILAEVTKGKQIVLHADVTAEVTRPMQASKIKVLLNDKGQDPDNQANDGTYSGYFTAYVGKGRYSVTAHVSSNNNTQLAAAKPGSGSLFTTPFVTTGVESDLEADYEYPLDHFNVIYSTTEAEEAILTHGKTVGPFQRVASGGSFQVTRELREEQVPPGKIRDLSVVEISPVPNGTLLVKLTWTWPGAHLTSGNASSVEIRASKFYGHLSSDFKKQLEVTEDDIVAGNLDPLPSGAKHAVTASVPGIFATLRPDGTTNWSGYLAARVNNSDGLTSNISNIVLVSHTPPFVTTAVRTEAMTTVTNTKLNEASETTATAAILAATSTYTSIASGTQSTQTQSGATPAATQTAPTKEARAKPAIATSTSKTAASMVVAVAPVTVANTPDATATKAQSNTAMATTQTAPSINAQTIKATANAAEESTTAAVETVMSPTRAITNENVATTNGMYSIRSTTVEGRYQSRHTFIKSPLLWLWILFCGMNACIIIVVAPMLISLANVMIYNCFVCRPLQTQRGPAHRCVGTNV